MTAMATIDLAKEMVAAQGAVTPAEWRCLERAGISNTALFWGLAGIAEVEIGGDFYQPLEGGARRVVVPVRVVDALSPFWQCPNDAVVYGGLADLVCFPLEAPSAWTLRTGAAQWLGCAGPQLVDPPPVLVHADPLEWLRADCIGIVPLTRDPQELRSLLSGCRSIAVTDADFGEHLKTILEQPIAGPTIVVMVKEKDAA